MASSQRTKASTRASWRTSRCITIQKFRVISTSYGSIRTSSFDDSQMKHGRTPIPVDVDIICYCALMLYLINSGDTPGALERKRVGSGKSVSVRVDLGGRLSLK